MHILFLTHYFPPEVNAPASRTFEHAVRWVRAGHEVTVITCAPNCPNGVVFDGFRNSLRPQVEWVEGVRVVRVWSYLAANAGTVRRIVNYLSYMVSAVLAAMRLARPDVVVATSPQFFCGWAGVWVSRTRRVPFVLEIRDIWPESIGTVGAIRSRGLLRFLEWLERRMYLAADHIVAVGSGYRERILQRLGGKGSGVRGQGAGRNGTPRISVVTNGVDLRNFVPRKPDGEFLAEFGLKGKFVCSYVGTIGMAHGLEVVIEAAKMLKQRGRDDVRFCLVGDGARREFLQQQAREAGVEELVVFTGRQPKERMPAILASTDACLVHLKGCELFGKVIPSKIFETMAMERTIIMGVRGEALEIVRRAEGGLEMDPDSPESLVRCVELLSEDRDWTGQLGKLAREFVQDFFDRDRLAEAMLDDLLRVAGVPTMEPVPAGAAADEEAEALEPLSVQGES